MDDAPPGKLFGKYRGIVIDSADPTNRGRLMVKAPAALGDREMWAMPCVPYAGDGVGFLFLPEPGTGVWVEFEAGNPSDPIWTGFFWGVGQMPANASPAAANFIRTRKVTLVFDDAVPGLRVVVDGVGRLAVDDDVVLGPQ